MLRYLSILFLSAIMVACSSDEVLSDEPTTIVEYKYTEHNQWIYEQMNHDYLWREDLPDRLDCNYSLHPSDFFKSILSPQDRFSYITENFSYNPNAAQYYGFGFQEYRDKNGCSAIQVQYVTSQNCRNAGMVRGHFYNIISENASNIVLRKVSYDENNGFMETDTIITLPTSSSVSTVIKDTIITKSQHVVGYLCYKKFDDITDLHKALISFRENRITDLVLDLRYNPGGYVSTCQYLCNCIVSENGYGQIFQQHSYNSILSRQNFESTGDERTYDYFKTPASPETPTLGVGIIALNLPRVYVLVSSHTASASEATIICLKPYMDVIIIGERTCGKGVGSRTISDSRYKYALHPITFRYYNADNETVPDEGLEPNYFVADGYSTMRQELGDENEPLLRTALDLILGNPLSTKRTSAQFNNSENTLTPIGEPSYVTDFYNKHNNEKN